MPPSLRTLTGCSACRQRRKKCDEQKPVCRACTQRNLQCTWPSPNRIDRRRTDTARRTGGGGSDNSNSPFPEPALSPTFLHAANLVTTGSEGDLEVDPTFLFQYCFKYFLPVQFHQPNFVVILDLSYLVSMCLDSLILRNAVAACAMSSVRTDKEKWQAAAQRYYLDAVQRTSSAIGDGSLKGEEDQLMAAVNWLCVFENSRLEAGLHSGMHLKALSKLLLMRTTESCEAKTQAVRAWERSVFESFIYHSAVVTLFDSYFDPMEDLQLVLDTLSNRFHDVSGISDFEAIVETVFWSPSLGAPPEIFVTLIQATRQARAVQSLSFEETSAIWSDYYKLREWQSKLDMACEISPHFSIWMGKPYVIAVRLLLLSNIYFASQKEGTANRSVIAELCNTMDEATTLLANIGYYLCRTWGKYLLWPLAMIGAAMSRQTHIKIVRRFLDAILKWSNSSTVLPVQRVLEERIWKNLRREEDLTEPLDRINLSGLDLILDSQVMHHACESSNISP